MSSVQSQSKHARDMRLGKVAVPPQIVRVMTPSPEDPALKRRIAELECENSCLRRALKEAFRESERVLGQKDAGRIMNAVCEYFGLSELDILSPRRQHTLVVPRQITMYLLKRLTVQSLPEIARFLRRDHSTVLHGMRKIEYLIQRDDELALDIAAIMASLQTEGDA